MIKDGIICKDINGVVHLHKHGKKIKYKPWLSDLFSVFYDSIMKKSVFPNKLQASMDNHLKFLKEKLNNVHNSCILELGTGSGNLSDIVSCDNKYVGLDISEGLLKIASKRFKKEGFNKPEFYIGSADDLPFQDNIFDICLCNLSLNFFKDTDIVIKEIKRVLKNKGVFICSVPIPERNKNDSIIRGNLYKQNELQDIFIRNGFIFTLYNFINGAILYFKAEKID